MTIRHLLKLSQASALLGLLGLAACQPRPIYSETLTLANGQWAYADSLVFSFDIADTSQRYDLFIQLEHGTDYPYANVYTLLEVYFPNGEKRREQVSIELADERGTWLGDCSGKTCSRQLGFMPKTAFQMPGTYRLCFKQHSRQDSLADLQAMRLNIFRHQD